MIRIAALLLALVLLPQSAFAAESAYTKLNLEKDCVFHSEYEQGASAYCTGFKGYPVHFSEGDLRQMVRFGHFYSLLGFWESFSQFNRINDTIEWRLKDGKPYAAILRWFIENADDNGNFSKASEGQVLVVSRVADSYNEQPNGCVIGYVDAKENSNANELARQISDELADDFDCIRDNPKFYGNRGKLSGDPSKSVE